MEIDGKMGVKLLWLSLNLLAFQMVKYSANPSRNSGTDYKLEFHNLCFLELEVLNIRPRLICQFVPPFP